VLLLPRLIVDLGTIGKYSRSKQRLFH
jgi:hypothetical protein